MPSPTQIRVSRLRNRRRAAGLREVALWLPDTRNPAYRARLAEQCRRLSQLTADEEAMADAFEREATRIPGWR